MNNCRRKEEINSAFSTAAQYYHTNALLQNETALRLANSLKPWRGTIPPGPLLEIGAGTGFYTKHLVRLFPQKKKVITDLSQEMMSECRNYLGNDQNIDFSLMDAEQGVNRDEIFSLITGNFVLQWFKDPAFTIEKLGNNLKPGGLFLFAFPGCKSFPEWKECCLELGLPYTGNPLPDIEEIAVKVSMGPYKTDFYEDRRSETYSSALDFFRHLKRIGVSANVNGKMLSHKDFRKLISYWNQKSEKKIKITYHLVFLAVVKKS